MDLNLKLTLLVVLSFGLISQSDGLEKDFKQYDEIYDDLQLYTQNPSLTRSERSCMRCIYNLIYNEKNKLISAETEDEVKTLEWNKQYILENYPYWGFQCMMNFPLSLESWYGFSYMHVTVSQEDKDKNVVECINSHTINKVNVSVLQQFQGMYKTDLTSLYAFINNFDEVVANKRNCLGCIATYVALEYKKGKEILSYYQGKDDQTLLNTEAPEFKKALNYFTIGRRYSTLANYWISDCIFGDSSNKMLVNILDYYLTTIAPIEDFTNNGDTTYVENCLNTYVDLNKLVEEKNVNYYKASAWETNIAEVLMTTPAWREKIKDYTADKVADEITNTLAQKRRELTPEYRTEQLKAAFARISRYADENEKKIKGKQIELQHAAMARFVRGVCEAHNKQMNNKK